MKKYALFTVSCCTLVLLAACGNQGKNGSQCPATSIQDTSREGLLQAVRAAEAKLKASPAIDAGTGNMAITAYTSYAKYFPNDTISAAFLFNAAGLASSTGQYTQAISMYENICTKYPQSRFIPECLLVEGFIYDNNLNDTAKAHAKYQELINKFPDNALSKQAAQAISLLGKSPDEIGKEFEEKNKANKKARS